MKVEYIDIDKLKLAEYNPRKLLGPDDEAFKNILNSIDSYGMVEPIIVNDDFTVIGGHQRINVLKHMGWAHVPCNIVKLDKVKEKQLNLALNKISGDWDEEKLYKILDDLKDEDFSNFGFSEDEFKKLEDDFKDLDNNENKEGSSSGNESYDTDDDVIDDSDIENAENYPASKIGDLFILGNHLLMCGDSTDYKCIDKLISTFDRKIDDTLIFMDPPYGIKVVGNDKQIGESKIAKIQEYEDVIGDETTETAENNYRLLHNLGFDNFIIFGGNYFLDFLKFDKSWIIWDKRGGMNSNDFGDGEIALSSLKHPIRIFKHVWSGMIQEGEREKRYHPTQKPIELIRNILNMFYEKNKFKYVIDFFGGSGSTLLASEKMNISSATMEMSPAYCDIIIKRYIKLKNGEIDKLYLTGGKNACKLREIDRFKDLLEC